MSTAIAPVENAEGTAVPPSSALVERLNVGTVVGLPVAVAAYFWANRLLPLDLPERAAWEAHLLFIAWALMLAHAGLRPIGRAWREQLWLAAGAFGLLPLVNALTTDRHLLRSLPTGDWVFAGFELVMLGFGVACALAAHRLTRRGMGRSGDAASLPSALEQASNGGRP